jgi:predicted transcriptional regulator
VRTSQTAFSKTETHNQYQTHKTPRDDEAKVTEEMDKHHIKELKEMIQEKKTEEPVEKVLVKFCARHGVSLDTCRIYYRRLVEKGEIKEK